MEDRMFKNKFAVKAALGMIRALKKVDRKREEELKTNIQEFEAFKKTKDYQKL